MSHTAFTEWLGRAGVLILLTLLVTQIASGQGRLYWTKPYDDALSIPQIMSSNFDGSSPSIVTRGFHVDRPLHLDIDQETNWVYWTDEGTGQISRSSPNGAEGGVLLPYLATPHGIAIDGVNGYMYWTTKPSIVRSRLDGSDLVEVVPGHGYAMGLEISVEDDLMFWTHGYGGTYRSKLDGTDVQEISSLAGDGLAVDGVRDKLYMPQGNVILRMDFDGAEVDTVVESPYDVVAVAVEPAADRLCWSQATETLGAGSVVCAATDGSDVTKILDLPAVPHGLAINYGSRMMYVTMPGKLMRCNYDGTGLEDVIQAMSYPIDVAVDPTGGEVYWVDTRRSPLVSRSGLNGMNREDLEVQVSGSIHFGELSAVGLDLTHRVIYAGFSYGGSFTPGGLVMGPMDGPLTTVISTDYEKSVTDIETEVGHGKVYYVLSGSLWSRNLDGSDPVELVTSVGPGIAVGAEYLYWSDPASHMLRRSNPDGTMPVNLLSGIGGVGDLAVDAAERYLWWVEKVVVPENATPFTGVTHALSVDSYSIMRLELGQASAQQIVTSASPIGGFYVSSPPSDVTLIAPVGGAADLPTTVTLMWTHPPDAQRFDVQVASDGSAGDVVLALNTPVDEVPFVAPVAESSYQWHVRPTGSGGNGAWTSWSRFTVGASGPLAPTLLEPANEETGVAIDPTFRWVNAPEAAYHHLQVADTISFDPPLIDVDSLTDDFFIGDTLEHERTYYWRVGGFADDGQYTFSAARRFTTVVAAPPAVTLIAPPPSAEGVVVYAAFSWEALAEADSYRLEVATDSQFAQVVASHEGSETSYTLDSPLAHDTRHYWRVLGTNAGGDGPWSAIRSFTTVIAAPASITLVTPEASAFGVPAYTVFSWQPLEGVNSYRLEVASDSLFTQTVTVYEGTETTHAVESPLAYDTKFYWRVRGTNQAGDGPWSEVRSFRTVIGTDTEYDPVPTRYALYQNYPNPFARSTDIRYDLPKTAHVSIGVFDALGRQLDRLVDGTQPPGTHTVTFQAGDHPGGLYVYRMRAGEFERVVSMIIAR